MCDVLKNKQVWRRQTRGKASRSNRGHAVPLSPHSQSHTSTSSSLQEESIAPYTDMSNPQSSSSGVIPHDGVRNHVQFGNCVRVLLIPSRHEYIAAGLGALMWWEDKEYNSFKQQAFQELIDYIDCHPGIDAKEAFNCMYRSTLDYEGEVICVESLESVSSLSTISCSPSGDSEVQDKGVGDLWDAVEESNVAANDVEESNLTPDAVEVIGELAFDSGRGANLNAIVDSNADCSSHDVIFGNSVSTGYEPVGDVLFSTASEAAVVSHLSTEAMDGQQVHSSQKESGRDGYLRSLLSESTIWYDLELMRLQTQRIVLLRGSGSDAAAAISVIGKDPLYNSIDDAMADIAKDIEERSQKGPDIVLVSMILSATILYICVVVAIVNCTSVIRVEARVPVLWSAAFIINVIAVSVPGRLDRMYSDGSHIKPWQSLFEPSPWAFAIWGVIYLTELLVTMYLCVFYKSVSSEFGTHGFQSALPYWTAGNCLQALWCFVFRPEFKSRLWIPSCCLFLSSLSLLGAYNQFYMVHPSSAGNDKELWNSSAFQAASNSWALVVARSIIAVHSTWMMGAALINFNSWIALSSDQRFSRRTHIAIAFMSAWFIATVGMLLSMYSSDISFALTCAWTLDALASRSLDKSKLMNKSHSDIDRSRCSSTPEVLETLSIIESILSGIVKCVAVGVVLLPFAAGYLTSNYIE